MLLRKFGTDPYTMSTTNSEWNNSIPNNAELPDYAKLASMLYDQITEICTFFGTDSEILKQIVKVMLIIYLNPALFLVIAGMMWLIIMLVNECCKGFEFKVNKVLFRALLSITIYFGVILTALSSIIGIKFTYEIGNIIAYVNLLNTGISVEYMPLAIFCCIALKLYLLFKLEKLLSNKSNGKNHPYKKIYLICAIIIIILFLKFTSRINDVFLSSTRKLTPNDRIYIASANLALASNSILSVAILILLGSVIIFKPSKYRMYDEKWMTSERSDQDVESGTLQEMYPMTGNGKKYQTKDDSSDLESNTPSASSELPPPSYNSVVLTSPTEANSSNIRK